MPPVLHVAFDELARCRAQQMLANQRRLGMHERHHVLQLIAKAEGAARLIERGATPQARADELIEQPSVGKRVDRGIRRSHLNGAERLAPAGLRPVERGMRSIAAAPAAHEVARLGRALAGAEAKDDFALRSGCELERDAKRAARVERGAEAAAELSLRQRGRRCQRAPATEEIAPIAARTPLCALDVEERDAI